MIYLLAVIILAIYVLACYFYIRLFYVLEKKKWRLFRSKGWNIFMDFFGFLFFLGTWTPFVLVFPYWLNRKMDLIEPTQDVNTSLAFAGGVVFMVTMIKAYRAVFRAQPK